MKITRDKFFVLTTYEALLQNLNLVEEYRINCSVYLSAHKVLDGYKKDDIDSIKGFFDKSGLSIITHGPYLDLNPGSLDKKIRQTTLNRLIQTLEVSKLFGSRHITFHSGYKPDPYKKYKDEWVDNSIETWKEFVSIAEKDNVSINIENAFEETPELLIKIIEVVDSPNFKLCFDAGHFNAFARTSPLEAFSMLPAKVIGEIHLSDNDGTDDQHLPLGEGNIDLVLLFKKVESLRITPIFTLEPRDIKGAEKDLAYLKKKNLID